MLSFCCIGLAATLSNPLTFFVWLNQQLASIHDTHPFRTAQLDIAVQLFAQSIILEALVVLTKFKIKLSVQITHINVMFDRIDASAQLLADIEYLKWQLILLIIEVLNSLLLQLLQFLQITFYIRSAHFSRQLRTYINVFVDGTFSALSYTHPTCR
jgi:hypothetical protein